MSTLDNTNVKNLSSVVCIYQQVFHEKSYWHLQLDSFQDKDQLSYRVAQTYLVVNLSVKV